MKTNNHIINMRLLSGVLLCVLLLLTAGGCQDGNKIDMPMDIDDLTLTDMWEAVTAEAGDVLREETANLYTFQFETDEKGNVQLIGMELWGLAPDGVPTFYSIGIQKNRKLTICYDETDPDHPVETYHPSILFSQVDEIGLPYLQEDTDGFSIRVNFQYGDWSFDNNQEQFKPFHLKDGQLLPLTRLEFEDAPFVGGMKIGMTAINDTPYTGIKYWFIDEDLVHAEIIEYTSE